MKQLFLTIVILISLLSCSVKEKRIAEINIIPKPLTLQKGEGTFTIDSDTRIILNDDSKTLKRGVEVFTDIVNQSSTFKLKSELKSGDVSGENAIVVSLSGDENRYGHEGYSLKVTSEKITVEAAESAGVFYAFQTLRQLFPPELEDSTVTADEWYIPAVEVFDKPTFKWRGQLLDVSRHFLPMELLKKNIDYLARYKMNIFHLHLTDDQGWRVEIKKYPKLTEVGAWRVDYNDMGWWGRPAQKPGDKATYGGYFTQDQIRELVQYAADRFISILPEIDVPGHSQSFIASYPEVSCDGKKYYVATGGVAKDNTVCPGKEITFKVIEDILNEVLPLFPGDYFHIGGDECNKSQWKKCADCQRRIKNEKLKNEHELQSYFIKRVEKMVNAHGKILIGWDEILEGGLAPNATVMSWRGEKGGIASAKMGHDVVMSPNTYCYLDLKQGNPALEPNYGYSHLWLSTTYSYAPMPEALNSEEKKHILGVQGNLWGESIRGEKAMNYMLFPRLLAIAEVGWTHRKDRGWNDFVERLEYNLVRLKNLGIGYAPSMYNVNVKNIAEKENEYQVELKTERGGIPIHYTLDGSEPTATSEVFKNPVRLNETVTLKAVAFKDGKKAGRITTYNPKKNKEEK